MPTDSEQRNAPAPSPPAVDSPLVAPIVTLLAIGGMLLVAHSYERLPVQAPACGLRTSTGIPCVACGGTRSMMSLSHGRILDALAFNPLIFLAVMAAIAWAVIALARTCLPPKTRPPLPPRRIPVWIIVTGILVAFVANWFYLYLYLAE